MEHEGDERAARFEALFIAHYAAVVRYARRRSSHAVADDVVGDVFLVAWRRLEAVPDDPLPWLLAAARRTLANQRRATPACVVSQGDRFGAATPRRRATLRVWRQWCSGLPIAAMGSISNRRSSWLGNCSGDSLFGPLSRSSRMRSGRNRCGTRTSERRVRTSCSTRKEA